ncbi:hypothetical protein QO003_000047 [Arthrobacter silviterrae]|uniref:DUF4352 domain-containing protein n=1 Tax=Arthrobacter silviterrae TaxID=2026658 RepID=A0ABX0D8E2_9MICC|nr:hypothetical protein [Arthrobacter silviterrae]MDQ0275744.1 hypothetical protein [Arthrobacter silviterrae]NGN83156.1 hypothetical protein [Arthrobacter silviterrae]
MNRSPVIPIFIASVIVLAGCGGAAATTSQPVASRTATAQPALVATTPAPTTAPPTVAPPTLSVRGNHIKAVGEPAGLTDTNNGNMMVKFTVDKIIVDPQCTGPGATKPENGHFIEIVETVVTGTAAKTNPALASGFAADYGWTLVTPDGNTSGAGTATSAALACLPGKDQIENSILPGDKSTGAFVIDVPSTRGTLVYKIMGVDAGWEYQIPGK